MATCSYDTPAIAYLLVVEFIGVFNRDDMLRIVRLSLVTS